MTNHIAHLPTVAQAIAAKVTQQSIGMSFAAVPAARDVTKTVHGPMHLMGRVPLANHS